MHTDFIAGDQVFQGAHAMSGSGSNTLLSEVILYMLSPQNFILPLFEKLISVTSHKQKYLADARLPYR